MRHTRLLRALILAALPVAGHAQAVHKCAQPTGGTVYQSTPCPTTGKPVAHPTAAQLNAERASNPAPARPQVATSDPYADGHRRRDCTVVLQNQSVLKRTGGRVYITDTAGQRQYVDDRDRPALLADAERKAAKLCD